MEKFGYKVSINQYQDSYSNERDENGDSVEYGWHESSHSNSFSRITKVDKGGYPDIVSDFDFKKGDDVFVVWFEYSTGDSFGSSYRGSIEAVGVFKDKVCAKELRDAIEAFTKNSDANTMNSYKFECETSDGQKFEYGFAPWVGYFETLEDVHIESTEIR